MKCPSCGYEDQAKFCKKCGAPLVSDQKADFVGAPKYTGVTIPPPTAVEGFKADDIDELGLRETDPHLAELGPQGGESFSNTFGMLMIVVLVVAIAIFALKMFVH